MKRALLFLIAAAAVLGGLWLALRPPPADLSAPAAAPAPAAGAVKRFELRPLPAEALTPVLHARQGDTIEFVVTAAGDDELHLHGYDLALDLKAGEPGTLRFVAEHAGRFDLELHHAHAELAVLEVQPR
ncbi:hypothetical protein [Solimonas soli]|uniref:hypothetical protein n=1 Tax=Solimonas soli TaxID=413479 RepID=UPI0012F94BB1|nr:hypothetical protein [Solimonas soli]